MTQVTPVILCGGSGTRLWPLSRTVFPKQFLCLTGNESLFQQAAQRLAALGNDSIQVAAHVIVSGEDHHFLAFEQLREVGIDLGTALLEPIGRNTAPDLGCIGHCTKCEKTRPAPQPCRTNHCQGIGLNRRLATSHCTSRAGQHRHLGRPPHVD
jgi:mannose-1-phosphate guanylyltransferase